MSGATSLLFRWRWDIASPNGPASTTRHVLFTLSIHMNEDGQAFPSIALLAIKTGLSDRAVRKHLKIAEKEGWITRKLWRDKGKDWAGYRYCATLPKRQDAPEPRSVPNQHAPELHADGAEREGNMVRNDVPTNTIVNTTNNSTENAFQMKSTKGSGWQEFHKMAQTMLQQKQMPR